VINRTTN